MPLKWYLWHKINNFLLLSPPPPPSPFRVSSGRWMRLLNTRQLLRTPIHKTRFVIPVHSSVHTKCSHHLRTFHTKPQVAVHLWFLLQNVWSCWIQLWDLHDFQAMILRVLGMCCSKVLYALKASRGQDILIPSWWMVNEWIFDTEGYFTFLFDSFVL